MYCTAARTWWDLGLHLLSGRHLVILGLGYSCMLAACWLMPCHRATASRLRRSTEDAARPKSITLMGACTHHTSHITHFVYLCFTRKAFALYITFTSLYITLQVSQSFWIWICVLLLPVSFQAVQAFLSENFSGSSAVQSHPRYIWIPVLEQEILWFDVTMNEVVVVQIAWGMA